MSCIPAIIFDMDGVVINNFKYHNQAWQLFSKKYNLEFGTDFKTRVFGGTSKEHLEGLFKRSLTDEEVKKYENEKESLYRQLFEPYIKPVQGLEPFLKLLRENGFPIALATSAPPVNVEFVLEQTKLMSYFPIILDSTCVKKGKPDPEIFIKAAHALNSPVGKCIVFEDSINGITAAKRAGMKVIAITTTHSANEILNADLIIDNFDDLDDRQLRNLL